MHTSTIDGLTSVLITWNVKCDWSVITGLGFYGLTWKDGLLGVMQECLKELACKCHGNEQRAAPKVQHQ